MSAVTAVPAAYAEPHASAQDWLAVIAGALGALIASLDISIVNSALPQIQGEIGATGTEGTWIGTGYLVSEVVMIPLSAWLSRTLGLRTLLLTCGTLFTVFSMECGLSHNLAMMAVGRVGQGFFGGALIPTAQTIVRTRLPQHQIPVGMTIFGLIVLLGPLLGPVVGGWLTENWSWQWCFFINLPVAIALITLLLVGMPHEPANLHEVVNADWLGIVGMSVGLSSLTVVLEEGQRDQWFDSDLIRVLTTTAVLGLSAMIVAQFTARRPVIKLRLLKNFSYASVIIIIISIGMVLYDILYVLPQFLSIISGYNAEQSGWVLALSGLPAFLMMPVLPRIIGRANIRVVVTCGLVCFAASCFIDIHLTAQSAGGDFVVSQILRGFGQILSFMPLNQASVGAVSREDTADAAGLFNMARNLGGSLGLALLGVFIDRRVEDHADVIRESVSANSPLLQERLAGQAAFFAQQNGGDLAYGHQQALGELAAQIHQQAMVMTYSECFWILGIALVVMLPLVLLLRPPPRRPGPPRRA
ncbi:MAG TPA: DHA2 family efflux MFS transporter permease subunit [Steroidobacteraceae bacterium]|nr:DHA2 family efflux MFS transporter permease subunit [Steroidobacteraceae bacterium]